MVKANQVDLSNTGFTPVGSQKLPKEIKDLLRDNGIEYQDLHKLLEANDISPKDLKSGKVSTSDIQELLQSKNEKPSVSKQNNNPDSFVKTTTKVFTNKTGNVTHGTDYSGNINSQPLDGNGTNADNNNAWIRVTDAIQSESNNIESSQKVTSDERSESTITEETMLTSSTKSTSTISKIEQQQIEKIPELDTLLEKIIGGKKHVSLATLKESKELDKLLDKHAAGKDKTQWLNNYLESHTDFNTWGVKLTGNTVPKNLQNKYALGSKDLENEEVIKEAKAEFKAEGDDKQGSGFNWWLAGGLGLLGIGLATGSIQKLVKRIFGSNNSSYSHSSYSNINHHRTSTNPYPTSQAGMSTNSYPHGSTGRYPNQGLIPYQKDPVVGYDHGVRMAASKAGFDNPLRYTWYPGAQPWTNA